MKKIKYLVLACCFCCFLNLKVHAQEPTTEQTEESEKSDSDAEKANNFGVSVTGGSNMIQKGKKPAVTQYYLAPSLSYSHRSGFSAGLGANLVKESKKFSVDNISANLGYSKTFFEQLSLGASYAYGHYFSSAQIASTESNTASLSGSWSNSILTPSLSVSYAFGQASDFLYNAGLSHDFSFDGVFTDSDNFSIPVALTASAGTSNYYQEYVKRNPGKVKAKKKAAAISAEDINTSFALTALVLESGLSYTIQKFTISSGVSYILMTNDSSTIELDNSPVITFTLAYAF